jgi:hypothetical protein
MEMVMAKRPDSFEDFQRKQKEKEKGGRQDVIEYTRGQQDDRDTHIKRGQEAWMRHKQDATWADWMQIGEALSIGRQDAMATAGTNAPVGSRYNAEFGNWLTRHKFDDIDKGDRSRLFEVMDNQGAIEAWRGTLTQAVRLRLNHPSSVLRKWKTTTVVKVPKEPKPTLKDSVANLAEANDKLTRENEALAVRLQEAEAARELAPSPAADTPAMSPKDIAAMIVERFPRNAAETIDEIRRLVHRLIVASVKRGRSSGSEKKQTKRR